jgi:hypothetical protein
MPMNTNEIINLSHRGVVFYSKSIILGIHRIFIRKHNSLKLGSEIKKKKDVKRSRITFLFSFGKIRQNETE